MSEYNDAIARLLETDAKIRALKKAAQLALEALEFVDHEFHGMDALAEIEPAIKALREALANLQPNS